MRTLLCLFLLLAVAAPAVAAEIELVKPSAADPGITAFDDPHVVIANVRAGPAAPLAIFMPGTGGKPQNVLPLLNVIASQGYRVIGLSYDDVPAVVQRCPQNPDPGCSAAFRAMRVYGEGTGPVTNPPAEAIVPRLTALLATLARTHPKDGWGAYLKPDGSPAWDRILVSGLSQGAGMAAFIAKREAVYRVVLFSSPWDYYGVDKRIAPWIAGPSATPPERWWAERHVRENTTDLLAISYRDLAVPADHILLFDAGLPPGALGGGPNPFHGSTVTNPVYASRWKTLYGRAGG